MQEQIDEFLDYVATERGYSENTLPPIATTSASSLSS